MEDLIEYFEEAHYDACIELKITTEDMFHNMKDNIYSEAEDDILTEPLRMNGYDFDEIMSIARERLTFDNYMKYKNDNWDLINATPIYKNCHQ